MIFCDLQRQSPHHVIHSEMCNEVATPFFNPSDAFLYFCSLKLVAVLWGLFWASLPCDCCSFGGSGYWLWGGSIAMCSHRPTAHWRPELEYLYLWSKSRAFWSSSSYSFPGCWTDTKNFISRTYSLNPLAHGNSSGVSSWLDWLPQCY